MLLGPPSSGSLPTESSHTVSWMGDDRILAIDGLTNDYLLLRFDIQNMPHDGPLGFTSTGRGNLNKGEFVSVEFTLIFPIVALILGVGITFIISTAND